jgi:hypothetical protein
MNNEKLDKAAAEIMGWEKIKFCREIYSIEDGNSFDSDWCGQNCTDPTHKDDWMYYHAEVNPGRWPNPPFKIFSPSTRWDHCGILIEWAEKNGKSLEIIGISPRPNIHQTRISFEFGCDETASFKDIDEFLAPHHITSAFVKAFDTKCKERCEGTHGSQGPPGQCVNQCSGKHIGDEHFCDQECNIPKEGEEWK